MSKKTINDAFNIGEKIAKNYCYFRFVGWKSDYYVHNRAYLLNITLPSFFEMARGASFVASKGNGEGRMVVYDLAEFLSLFEFIPREKIT